nr:hypothetical protein Iba_chr05eCG4440 [Ipomoea batatas]GMD01034.1 hypothetical protein Iba_chr05fCG3560 [Ipomoea batatas]
MPYPPSAINAVENIWSSSVSTSVLFVNRPLILGLLDNQCWNSHIPPQETGNSHADDIGADFFPYRGQHNPLHISFSSEVQSTAVDGLCYNHHCTGCLDKNCTPQGPRIRLSNNQEAASSSSSSSKCLEGHKRCLGVGHGGGAVPMGWQRGCLHHNQHKEKLHLHYTRTQQERAGKSHTTTCARERMSHANNGLEKLLCYLVVGFDSGGTQGAIGYSVMWVTPASRGSEAPKTSFLLQVPSMQWRCTYSIPNYEEVDY